MNLQEYLLSIADEPETVVIDVSGLPFGALAPLSLVTEPPWQLVSDYTYFEADDH